LAIPLFLAEIVVCIPAMLTQSVWAALIPLALIQFPFLFVLLAIAGRASERAIATGEPVSIWRVVTRKA
jgi:hypothetical protein